MAVDSQDSIQTILTHSQLQVVFFRFPWLSSGDARCGGERINIWIRWNPINHPPKMGGRTHPREVTARWLWVSNKDWDWDDSSGSTKGFRSLWVSSPKGSPQLWQVKAMWKRPIPRPLNHKHPSEKALVVKGKPKHRVFLSSWNTSSTTESTNRARDLNCCKIYRLSKYPAIHFPFQYFHGRWSFKSCEDRTHLRPTDFHMIFNDET